MATKIEMLKQLSIDYSDSLLYCKKCYETKNRNRCTYANKKCKFCLCAGCCSLLNNGCNLNHHHFKGNKMIVDYLKQCINSQENCWVTFEYDSNKAIFLEYQKVKLHDSYIQYREGTRLKEEYLYLITNVYTLKDFLK